MEKPAGFGEVKRGLTVPGKIEKVGYKGVDITEQVFDGFEIGATRSSVASRPAVSTRRWTASKSAM